MRQLPWECEGHPGELVAADLIVNIGFAGRGGRPLTYSLCIECAEAHYDIVQEWDHEDYVRIREYWWAKHPNCFRSE